jgi:hypothetical protein
LKSRDGLRGVAKRSDIVPVLACLVEVEMKAALELELELVRASELVPVLTLLLLVRSRLQALASTVET